MTDTTDTNAMREAAIKSKELSGIANYRKGDEAKRVFNAMLSEDLIIKLLDQLEAERQRADEWKERAENANAGWLKVIDERDAAAQKSRNYEQVAHGLAEEIAALKGDQVLVGEIVAWAGTNRDMGITREVDFRFLRFDVLPGTKLYAVEPAPATIQLCDPPAGVVMRPRFEKPEDCECSSIDYCESCLETMMSKPSPAVKSDLLTRAEALAVETRALASRIQAGE